jgi:hypothetical protein
MARGIFDWFGRRKQRIGSRHVDRLALAIEFLEPRHLLAGDCLGFFTGMGPNWHPDGPTDWGPAVVQAAAYGVGQEVAHASTSETSARELVFLDEVAAQLGEVIELDDVEPWSCEGDWYDPQLS